MGWREDVSRRIMDQNLHPDPQRQSCLWGSEPLSNSQGCCLLSSATTSLTRPSPSGPHSNQKRLQQTSGPRVPQLQPMTPPKFGITSWRHKTTLSTMPLIL